jgi:hypothetical protein
MRLNNKALLRSALVLLVAGVVLILPMVDTLLHPSDDSEDDLGIAFAKVARIRLDSFKTGSPLRLKFRVPDSSQWKRLRNSWGDYGYLLYGVRKDRWLIPFAELDLDVEILRAGTRLHVGSGKDCPYGVSRDTMDCGLSFKPAPGDELEMVITARSGTIVPEGELVVEPYWGGYEKDRVIGAAVSSRARPYIEGIAAVGIVCLIASAGLGIVAGRNQPRA